MTTQAPIAIWMFVPLAFLLYVALLYSERRKLVLKNEGSHIFRPIWTIRLFYSWTMVFGAALIFGPAIYLHRLEAWSTSAGILAILLAFVTWPPSLYVGWSSLKSARWWGGETEIAWDNVASITYDYHGFRTIVTSTDGSRIEHTLIDCDPFGFQSEIVSRSDHHLAHR
jgi:hypothetical protein